MAEDVTQPPGRPLPNIRIDLSHVQPGAYAELRPTVPYALMRVAQQAQDDWSAFADAGIRRLVKRWNVTDDDGNALPPPGELTPEQIDDIDVRIIAPLVRAIGELLGSLQPDPNFSGASSTS